MPVTQCRDAEVPASAVLVAGTEYLAERTKDSILPILYDLAERRLFYML